MHCYTGYTADERTTGFVAADLHCYNRCVAQLRQKKKKILEYFHLHQFIFTAFAPKVQILSKMVLLGDSL